MARYKGREVRILREIPHTEGDQVAIEHIEFPTLNEIVPRSQVVVTKEEMDAFKKQREERAKEMEQSADWNDYRVEGVNEEATTPVPTYKEVDRQRAAENAIVRAEEQRIEQEKWEKAHPKAPAGSFQQLEAVKVVPYKEETEKMLSGKGINTVKAGVDTQQVKVSYPDKTSNEAKRAGK
jgi:hypothetical protein